MKILEIHNFAHISAPRETLRFALLHTPQPSIDVAWIYMVGKGLLFGLYGGLEEGGGVFREVILPGDVLGIRLILVGREGNHVVERSYFHRSQLSHHCELA